ncbi:hypothetical protein Pelo_12584 [Pelomyxa schiedti]|nr:hypothetical protein Pelo_12584 [Pelomyxa schiedti]
MSLPSPKGSLLRIRSRKPSSLCLICRQCLLAIGWVHDSRMEKPSSKDERGVREHVAWARDQFVALALSHHRRCGMFSPARVLPPPVLVDAIGRQWVMRVSRTVAIGVKVAHPMAQIGSLKFLCVGVSCTVGVTWLRRVECPPSTNVVAGFEDCVLLWERGTLATMYWPSLDYREEHVDRSTMCGYAGGGYGNLPWRVLRNDKWLLMYQRVAYFMWKSSGEHRAVWLWPLAGANICGPCHTITSSQQQKRARWIELLEGDRAVLSVQPVGYDYKFKQELWLVDLNDAYQLSEFVPVETVPGFAANRSRQIQATFSSSKNSLIAAVCDKRQDLPGYCELKSMTPKSRKLLKGNMYKPLKIDARHFLEGATEAGGTYNGTLKLFSTEDLTNPTRIFHYDDTAQVRCSNGFIAFKVDTDTGDYTIDLCDTIYGTWLLRHQVHPDPSHGEHVYVYLDTCVFGEDEWGWAE